MNRLVRFMNRQNIKLGYVHAVYFFEIESYIPEQISILSFRLLDVLPSLCMVSDGYGFLRIRIKIA